MKHWYKATAEFSQRGITRCASGFSSLSPEDAQLRAQEAARASVERAQDGNSAEYPYGVRPLAEPVLREWPRDDGSLSGLLSVNSRGCVVLNTAAVMFVDVDLPKPPKAAGGLLAGLFGRRKPAAPVADTTQPALEKLRAFVGAYPAWGFRVYRTAAGLRYLCTSALHDPAAPESLAVLAELGSDPLYLRLCEKQQTFRARLTPKPWRVDQRAYRHHYDPNNVARKNLPFALAEADVPPQTAYEKEASKFAVCAFVEHVGASSWHPEAQSLATIHDQYTRPDSALPLA